MNQVRKLAIAMLALAALFDAPPSLANPIDPCQLEPNLVLSNAAYGLFRQEIDQVTNGDYKQSAAYNIVGLPRLATYDAENQPDRMLERSSQPAYVAAQIRILKELLGGGASDVEKLKQFGAFHSYFRQKLLDLAKLHGVPYGQSGGRLIKPYPPPHAARRPGTCRR